MASDEQTPAKSFADYKAEGHTWITLSTGEYYPDILPHACKLYEPVLVLFGELIKTSESSKRLLLQIADNTDGSMRTQLMRVFRKYVSPMLSVEMLKRKSDAQKICDRFGDSFRPIQEVQAAFVSRPLPDEALCAVLWEYHTRGQKGYDLTERFFSLFQELFPELKIKGPQRAGQDILLGKIFADYPHPKRPVDFVIYDSNDTDILAIGLARYDSDRGGSQEDDRTGGNENAAREILRYAQEQGLGTKIIFLNDGPGLLLGSMWNDYARLENSQPDRILVLTLRMIPERLTLAWLHS